ncbi:MAG: hypothetical protein LBQ13_01195 [Endomicrobium sp.]|jgi:hypothetical protein|nr:hypothetical protein [Endomicrobium sp.]
MQELQDRCNGQEYIGLPLSVVLSKEKLKVLKLLKEEKIIYTKEALKILNQVKL